MQVSNSIQQTSFGFRIPNVSAVGEHLASTATAIGTEEPGALSGMFDVNFEDKKVTFAPFKGYNMFAVNFKDDFLKASAARNVYQKTVEAEKKSFQEQKNKIIHQR